MSENGFLLLSEDAGAGGANLSGQTVGALERVLTASVTTLLALSGQSIAAEERVFTASVSEAKQLAGSYSATDSFTRPGLVAGATPLLGQFIASGEKTYPAGLSAAYAITGQYISSEEVVCNCAVVTVSLPIGGVRILSDELSRNGTLAALINLAGQFSGSLDRVYAALLTIDGGPQGLAGQRTASDERYNPGSIQSLTSLLGSFSKLDEKTFLGSLFSGLNILGATVPSDERSSIALLTAGGVSLVGQFIQSGEILRVSVLASGQIITKDIRVVGRYGTTVRVIGRYDNG